MSDKRKCGCFWFILNWLRSFCGLRRLRDGDPEQQQEDKVPFKQDEDKYEASITHQDIGYRHVGLGMILQTYIHNNKAFHEIVEVHPGSIAEQIELLPNSKLTHIQDIKTDGMNKENIEAQFLALNTLELKLTCITEDKNSETVQAELQLMSFQTKHEIKVAAFTKGVPPEEPLITRSRLPTGKLERDNLEKHATTPKFKREISVKSVTKDDVSEITVEHDIITVAKPKVIYLCDIQHPSSKTYLSVEDNKLVSQQLQEDSNAFQRGTLPGYVANKPCVIFAFRPEHTTDYITILSPNNVGLKNLPEIKEDVKVLNSHDPRLFYHKQATDTKSCFEFTALRDHYLAIDSSDKVYIKEVHEDDLYNATDVHFILRPAT